MARITQPSTAQPPVEETRRPNAFGVFLISCLPLVAICLILFASGGTRPGFLIPAITCGAVLGMLMFIAFREGPAR